MTKEQIAEIRNLKKVQNLNDFFLNYLSQKEDLTFLDIYYSIRFTRKFTLKYFPGKNKLYNMIYRARFIRLIDERNLFGKIKN